MYGHIFEIIYQEILKHVYKVNKVECTFKKNIYLNIDFMKQVL